MNSTRCAIASATSSLAVVALALTGCAPLAPMSHPEDRAPERVIRRPAPGASGTAVRVVLYQTSSGPVMTDALLTDDVVVSHDEGELWVVDDEGAVLARAPIPGPAIVAPPPLEGETEAHAVVDWTTPLEVLLPWREGAVAVVVGEQRIEFPPRLDVEVKADEVVPDAVPVDVLGDGAHRWDVVFLAEGFTASEMGVFDSLARRYAQEIRATSPYREYTAFFNFWMIRTPSATSGIGVGTAGGDTRFGCYVEATTGVLRCDRREDAFTTARASLADANIPVIVTNDRFGGRSVASGGARNMIMSSTSGPMTFAHELGHIFELADEYVYTDGAADAAGAAASANCSTTTPARWESIWTPVDPRVGSYRGCSSSGFYRPTDEACLMRTLSAGAFCPVCTEELVLRIPQGFFSVTPVARPEDGGLIRVGRTPIAFRAEYAAIPSIRHQWSLDGAPLATTADTHSIDACAFGADAVARHTLEVSAVNDTAALRPAYRRVRVSTRSWTLVGDAACGEPEAPADTMVAIDLQSAHPYANGASETFDVRAPAGTSRMRLHFARLDLESSYDFLDVLDSSGAVVERYTGAHGETITAEISGDRATLRLRTDGSVTRWGFALDRIVVVNEAAPMTTWTREPVMIESAHPYADNFTRSWTVSSAGASAVRLHFASLATEANYDFVNVFDATGSRVASYTGNLGEFVSEAFANPPLRIELRTDSSVSEQGFRIDWIEHR